MPKSVSPLNVIVITGASSGLGLALAMQYAAPGITLGLLGRNTERLDQIAQQCRNKGAAVEIAVVDITDADAMAVWLTGFDEQHPIDTCIANAGVSAGTAGGEETLSQVKHIMDVNVSGVLHTIHPVLDRMRQRKSGQIALISSMAGWVGLPGAPAYGMSKAAIRIYGQALRSLYAPQGIKVNVVCPGFIKTPMTDINPFPMPFMMDADQAAKIICEGLKRNKGLIVFPWQKFIIVRLLSMLPDIFVTWFGRRLPGKPSRNK